MAGCYFSAISATAAPYDNRLGAGNHFPRFLHEPVTGHLINGIAVQMLRTRFKVCPKVAGPGWRVNEATTNMQHKG